MVLVCSYAWQHLHMCQIVKVLLDHKEHVTMVSGVRFIPSQIWSPLNQHVGQEEGEGISQVPCSLWVREFAQAQVGLGEEHQSRRGGEPCVW